MIVDRFLSPHSIQCIVTFPTRAKPASHSAVSAAVGSQFCRKLYVSNTNSFTERGDLLLFEKFNVLLVGHEVQGIVLLLTIQKEQLLLSSPRPLPTQAYHVEVIIDKLNQKKSIIYSPLCQWKVMGHLWNFIYCLDTQ